MSTATEIYFRRREAERRIEPYSESIRRSVPRLSVSATLRALAFVEGWDRRRLKRELRKGSLSTYSKGAR